MDDALRDRDDEWWHFDEVTPEGVLRGATGRLGLGDAGGLCRDELLLVLLELAAFVVGLLMQAQAMLDGGPTCAGALTVMTTEEADLLRWRASRNCTDSDMRPSSDAFHGGSGAMRKGQRREREREREQKEGRGRRRKGDADSATAANAKSDGDTVADVPGTDTGDGNAAVTVPADADPEGMPEGLTAEEAEAWSEDAALHDPDKGLRADTDRPRGKQAGSRGHGIRIPKDAEECELAYAVPTRCKNCPMLAECGPVAEASHRKSFVDMEFSARVRPFKVLDPVCCPMGLRDSGDKGHATADGSVPAGDAGSGEAVDAASRRDATNEEATPTNGDDRGGVDGTAVTAAGDAPECYTLVTADRVGLGVAPAGDDDLTMGGAVFPRPEGTTMYGPAVRALVVCVVCVAMCAIERAHDVIAPMLGMSLSTGTVWNMVMAFAAQVEPVVDQILRVLREGGGVACCDGTSVDVGGVLHWVHGVSTEAYTFLTVHRSRGKAGLDAAGFLEWFTGVSVHDCWAPYWSFKGVTHALCNAHLLRELKKLARYFRGCRLWATEMSELIVHMKVTCDVYGAAGHGRLPDEVRDALRALYDELLERAREEIPPPPEPEPTEDGRKKRGRKKKGKALSLVERMEARKDEFLRFMDDFRVPFTNNLAERCFRMVGNKKHVSGCFRTIEGARAFAAIWSYLSTARKMGHSYWEAAYEASCGRAMGLIFPDGVEAAIAERKRESEGLPLAPSNTNAANAKDAA